MFQPLPSTRYDLNFSIFGFDVRVHPLFWVIGILLGYSAGSLERIAIWIIVLFVSILIHELGHSFMMRRFGVDSFIILYHLGGLAVPRSARRAQLTWVENILISLAGPFAVCSGRCGFGRLAVWFHTHSGGLFAIGRQHCQQHGSHHFVD